jgi:molecular chaperone GrpE (heat shock protein)
MILLGEIDVIENKPRQASKRWREAARIARELNDRELRFKAELELYKQALAERNQAVARAIQRRLQRLSPWISNNAPELLAFNKLLAENRFLQHTSVASTQRPASTRNN